MTETLHNALDAHFKNHRIIFWYDEGRQQYDLFQGYQSTSVEKIELANNEFGVKYRLFASNADTKFLIYSPYAKPADEDNWLLDQTEQHFIFAANQAAGYLQELQLDPELEYLVEEHLEFFANKKERRDPLQANLASIEGPVTAGDLLDAMLSSLVGEKRREREKLKTSQELIMLLFRDCASEDPRNYLETIRRFGLLPYLKKKIDTVFNYSLADEQGMESFLAHLLMSALNHEKGGGGDPTQIQAYTFIDAWRNSFDEVDYFHTLADRFEKELNIAGELKNLRLLDLVSLDLFKESDRIILQRLVGELDAERLSVSEALRLIERRKESYWYKTDTDGRIRKPYNAVEIYLRFLQEVNSIEFTSGTPAEIWRRYTSSWYAVDTWYRKFLATYREIHQEFLKPLLERIEATYTVGFLSKLSDFWHDTEPLRDSSWRSNVSEAHFFKRHVSPLLQDGKVVFVICSDALRFEVGKELAEKLSRENRIQVETEAAVALAPSYTQLGMAALLPHQELSVDPESMQVKADKVSTVGLEGRNKVLTAWFDSRIKGQKTKAFNAKEFMEKPLSLQQEEIEGLSCVYLYSSTIDSIGDNAKSEDALPDAVEREIEFLISLTKRIINLNRTHIFISADHGFLFQYTPVKEHALLQVEKQAGELQRDRRYLVGRSLKPDSRFFYYTAEELGIGTDFQVMLPKGEARIRKQGAGSRFVHGGISLQELAIPVVKIRKGREDDLRDVGFDILSGTGRITTNSISVKVIQAEPISAKVRPLRLSLRFEAQDGTVLSDQRDIRLESKDERQENRSFTANFVFSRAMDAYHGQQVNLMIYRETHGQRVPARDPIPYRIQISIAPDF